MLIESAKVLTEAKFESELLVDYKPDTWIYPDFRYYAQDTSQE